MKLFNIFIFKKLVKKDFSKSFFVISFVLLFQNIANSQTPITTDSRIKTFVYNENEVFKLDFQFGYQSSIEFGKDEKFETISVGDSHSWKITPVGSRIFIKPLDGDSKTNMTIITNKHSYHLDLQSHYEDDYLNDNLIYVARFYHPKDISNDQLFNFSQHNNYSNIAKADNNIITNSSPAKSFSEKRLSLNYDELNYNYTLSGSESISPVEVFDDGQKTYLKFVNVDVSKVNIFKENSFGRQERTSTTKSNSYLVVDTITNELTVKVGDDVVKIYNEGWGQ